MAIGNDFQLDVVANAQALDKSIKAVTTTKTYKIKIEADGTQTKTLAQTTEKLSNAQGQLLNVTTKYNKEGKQTSAVVKDISKNVKGLGADFVDTLGKVAKFGAVTALLGLFTTGVSEAIQTVKEFDDVLTDFKKVSDLSGDSLDAYTQKLGELGETVARTRSEMVEASTEFKKSGYSDEDSAQLAQIASLYQNVADSELSAGEASSYVISQMKAFNITADDAITIIDKTNEVSNSFAVSSTDISTALTKTSSALSAYGNTIDETIGLVVSGTEIMTGQASKVSKGLRSIGANIVKLANDSGTLEYTINGVTKSVDLFDKTTGDMKNTYQVLSEISDGWDEMTNAEKSALALSLAGKTQIDVFTSVLGNFDTAINATATSLDSQGSAMKENEAYMESMSA